MRVGTPSSRSSLGINHEIAQARWGIHPTLANNTVERTTQKVFRISCPHPSLTKRIRKNNRILCYNRLPCNVFADTLILGTVSKGGNKYAEVFATDFSWAQAYPMKMKNDAHEALSLIFSRRVCRIRWLLMDQRNMSLAIFRRNFLKQGASWNKRNLTLPGRMMRRDPFGNWNAERD